EVLILDEATSSLDSASEKYIQQMINMLRQRNKTIIIIAHRLSTIFQADKIVVLDKGKVVEEGTHSELLENKLHYYELCKNQFPLAMTG
ncbi:MAG TPA: peptidase C39, partial [Cyclobacteriaceae bacterium]|nr:peptidase C39 [Cyclobacteriaceae bacterium]